MTPQQQAQRFVQPADATSVADGDLSTSPEALAILERYGSDAWREWVARQGAARAERVAELQLPDPVVDALDPAEVATDEDVTDWPDAGVLRSAAEYLRAVGSARNLHEYWTRGPGLAKWASSRTPWRALRRHLAKYIKDKRKLDATTSAWYRDVFGRLPNG